MTLIELLVVVAIIGLLIAALSVGIRSYLQRSDDARRKSDIKKISQALEQYYNDHNGYPGSLAVTAGGATCGPTTTIAPYMREVPCDPGRGSMLPYLYIQQGEPFTNSRGETVYRGYRLLTALSYKADPQIREAGCSIESGCGGEISPGVPVSPLYNFGLAANASVGIP